MPFPDALNVLSPWSSKNTPDCLAKDTQMVENLQKQLFLYYSHLLRGALEKNCLIKVLLV